MEHRDDVGKPAGLFRSLGPGLVTGAADDDPSGIVTFSQAGAAFKYGLLWTVLLQIPLMSAVQMMCARIGRASGGDLGDVLRENYPRWVLWSACALLVLANTVTIAADIAGIGAGCELLTGANALWFVPAATALMLGLLAFLSYRTIARVLKWLTLALVAYVVAGVLAGPNWKEVLSATFVPRVTWKLDYLTTFVALFGTSITPYLFFWQAAQEVEEQKAEGKREQRDRVGATRKEMRRVRNDTVTGMAVSQVICYFIIVASGTTIYASGHHDIQTAQQAAQGLKSIGGGIGTVLFAAGLIGTGLLGVPTLAGSAAYAIGAAFNWKVGMNEPVTRAREFYGVIAAGMILGAALDFVGLSPVTLLFGAAVVNGLLAPPLLVVILLVANNPRIMKSHMNGRVLNLLGGATVLIMAGSALWLAVSWAASKL